MLASTLRSTRTTARQARARAEPGREPARAPGARPGLARAREPGARAPALIHSGSCNDATQYALSGNGVTRIFVVTPDGVLILNGVRENEPSARARERVDAPRDITRAV